MGQRGPQKKPTALIKLTGNAGHHSKKRMANEPKPNVEVPPCPPWLNSIAKTHWKYITKELLKMNMVHRADLGSLVLLCIAWGDTVQLTNRLKKKGGIVKYAESTSAQTARLTQERCKSIEVYIKLLAKFGLSPSDRSRMAIPSIPPENPEESEFESFKRKKGL